MTHLQDRDDRKSTRQLVLCPANTRRQTFELVENRLCGRDPDEGRRGGIVLCDEALDRLDELSDAVARAALDGSLADESEPAFYLIEP